MPFVTRPKISLRSYDTTNSFNLKTFPLPFRAPSPPRTLAPTHAHPLPHGRTTMTFSQQGLGNQDVPEIRDEKKPGRSRAARACALDSHLVRTVSLKSGQVSVIRSTKSAAKMD